MKNIARILLLLIVMMNPIIMKGSVEFQLTQYTTVDGLPNNTVRHILQDSHGDLWICTSNGLSRFDGTTFHNYRAVRDSQEPGLLDNRVQKVFEQEELLWVLTAKGLSCYDLKRQSFINYVAAGLQSPEFPKNSIHMLTDSQGRRWKVTEDDGLYVTEGRQDEPQHFTTASKNNPLPTNSLKCICQDKSGDLWIGTNNLGITQIKVLHSKGVRYQLEGENIRLLMPLDKERIAVGNRSGKLWIYDASLSRRQEVTQRVKSTYCILLDEKQNIWEGTKGAGLLRNGAPVKDSPYKDIYALLQDRTGNLWMGTFGAGLFCRDTVFLSDDEGSRHIRSLVEDGNGDLWAGTSNGVYVLDSVGVKSHLSMEDGRLLSNEIRTLFKDTQGNIYIAETGEGFAWIEGGKWGADQEANIRHFSEADSLVNNMVQSFVEDRDGFVWIATEFGISILNRNTQSLSSYFFSKNMLNNVYSENCGLLLDDGHIAFGTNNGILIIDPAIYNEGEKSSEIQAGDVTVKGQGKSRLIYVVIQWWKSPWAIAVYIAVVLIVLKIHQKVKKDKTRYQKTIEQLNAEKEEIRDQYSTEVQIRRDKEKSAQDEAFIRKVEAIASEEMSKSDFSSDDFAEQMGMGRTHFFNKMKKVTGYSPKEYIKRKRLKRAAELLSTTTLPVGEIALSVGIEDPLYFSRVFKQEYGKTPTEWRNKQ